MRRMFKRLMRSGPVLALGSWLITQYIRLAWATGRWAVEGADDRLALWDRKAPFILAIWHGRILMMPRSWPRGFPFYMLISQHRDGEMIAQAVKPLGIASIRGSGAKAGSAKVKGGIAALRDIVRVLKSGSYIGVTPDGPRGPRMRATKGVVVMARLAGVPIIPATWSARRRWQVNSWDRFLVPHLFTQGIILWGAPIVVPPDADDAQMEAVRAQIETTLNGLCDEADTRMGAPCVVPAAPPQPSQTPPQVTA